MLKFFKLIFLAVIVISTMHKSYSQTRNFGDGSQADMNIRSYEAFLHWDNKMKRVFKAAIENHKTDTLFVNNLIKSQKLWEAWRKAEIQTFYPKYPDSNIVNGSMQPLCENSKLIDWTEQRIKQLEIYSKGLSDNEDLCDPGR